MRTGESGRYPRDGSMFARPFTLYVSDAAKKRVPPSRSYVSRARPSMIASVQWTPGVATPATDDADVVYAAAIASVGSERRTPRAVLCSTIGRIFVAWFAFAASVVIMACVDWVRIMRECGHDACGSMSSFIRPMGIHSATIDAFVTTYAATTFVYLVWATIADIHFATRLLLRMRGILHQRQPGTAAGTVVGTVAGTVVGTAAGTEMRPASAVPVRLPTIPVMTHPLSEEHDSVDSTGGARTARACDAATADVCGADPIKNVMSGYFSNMHAALRTVARTHVLMRLLRRTGTLDSANMRPGTSRSLIMNWVICNIILRILRPLCNADCAKRAAYALTSARRRLVAAAIVWLLVLPFLVPYVLLNAVIRQADAVRGYGLGQRGWCADAVSVFGKAGEWPHVTSRRLRLAEPHALVAVRYHAWVPELGPLGMCLRFVVIVCLLCTTAIALLNEDVLVHLTVLGNPLVWWAMALSVVYGVVAATTRPPEPCTPKNRTMLRKLLFVAHGRSYGNSRDGNGSCDGANEDGCRDPGGESVADLDAAQYRMIAHAMPSKLSMCVADVAAVVLMPWILGVLVPRHAGYWMRDISAYSLWMWPDGYTETNSDAAAYLEPNPDARSLRVWERAQRDAGSRVFCRFGWCAGCWSRPACCRNAEDIEAERVRADTHYIMQELTSGPDGHDPLCFDAV